MKKLTIRISSEDHKKLKMLVVAQDTSINSVLSSMIKDYNSGKVVGDSVVDINEG